MASNRLRFCSSDVPRTSSSVLYRLHQVEREVEELQYRLRERPSLAEAYYGSRWWLKPQIAAINNHRLPQSSIDLIRQDVQDLSRHIQQLECIVARMYDQSASYPVRNTPRIYEQDRTSTQAKKKVHWRDWIKPTVNIRYARSLRTLLAYRNILRIIISYMLL